MTELKDHRALVTGASSGIGAAASRYLASLGCDLIITARRLDRLETLAEQIRADHGVQVDCIKMDLSKLDGASELWAAATGVTDRIDILVNNAGFGYFKRFADAPLELEAAMLQVNIVTLVELSHRFITAALGRGRRAYLLNIASIGAYQPVPYMASYVGTKSYVRLYTESIAGELRGTNVSATVLSPGGTRTEFSEVAGQPLGAIARSSMLDADRVARIGIRAMLRRRRSIVSGWINKINCFMLRFAPRRLGAAAAVMILGKPPATGALKPGKTQ